jgi:hypothetical protein
MAIWLIRLFFTGWFKLDPPIQRNPPRPVGDALP